MSGFLEYLLDMEGFFHKLRGHLPGVTAIFSWGIPATFSRVARIAKGWINPLVFPDDGRAFFAEQFDTLEYLGRPAEQSVFRGQLRPLPPGEA